MNGQVPSEGFSPAPQPTAESAQAGSGALPKRLAAGVRRDWAGEIEQHLRAVATAGHTVTLESVDGVDGAEGVDAGSERPGRVVIGLTQAAAVADGWGVFTAAVGQVRVREHVLEVGLGPDPASPEAWRTAGEWVGAHLTGGVVSIRLPVPASGSAATSAGTGSADVRTSAPAADASAAGNPVAQAPVGAHFLDASPAADSGEGLTACFTACLTAWFAGLTCGLGRGVSITVRLDLPGLTAAQHRQARSVCERGIVTGEAVRLAKSLVNAPANLATPGQVASWCEQLSEHLSASCTVLEEQDLLGQGWGCVLAVSAGSAQPARVVTLRYGTAARPDLTLVGKGVTFDSGGLSLKSPSAMQAMRNDKTGAATVLAVFAALVRLGSSLTIEVVLPLAENMPGSAATRPGDVVTALDGTQVQVMDTDFEGRLLLADALTHAQRSHPQLIVDVATLTHQAVVALGSEIGAYFSSEDGPAQALEGAAQCSGEPLWRLPLAQRYLPHIRTGYGLRNHPMNDTGRAITAALFLQHFVADTPWLHLDVAGPTWRTDGSSDGATGFAVATLIHLALGLQEA